MNIKVYDSNLVYKFTQPLLEVVNDLSYTGNTGAWQGRLSIELKKTIDDVDYENGDFVYVYEYPPQNKAGVLYYFGQVKSIELIAENNQEKVAVWLIGAFDLLNTILYSVWTKTDDPKDILQGIIDTFNSTYWQTLFTLDCPVHWSNVSISFSNKNCRTAIEAVCESVGRDFYCWPDGVVKAGDVFGNHTFTYKNDVQSLKIKLNWESLYNRLKLSYTGGSQTYNNVWSQTTYWLQEKSENKTDIQDLQTASDYWASFLAKNAYPKEEINITINDRYDISSIKPWDKIKILNSKYPVNDKVIKKVSRTRFTISLDVEVVDSLGTLGQKIFNQ